MALMRSTENNQDQLGCGLVRANVVRRIQEMGVLGKGIIFHLPLSLLQPIFSGFRAIERSAVGDGTVV